MIDRTTESIDTTSSTFLDVTIARISTYSERCAVRRRQRVEYVEIRADGGRVDGRRLLLVSVQTVDVGDVGRRGRDGRDVDEDT